MTTKPDADTGGRGPARAAPTRRAAPDAVARRLRWAARRLELRAFGLAPEQFSLAEGARAALGVAPPLVLAVATGEAWLGWAVFAAFWTCLCDTAGPQSLRLRILGTFVALGTLIAFVGSVAASAGMGATLVAGPVLVFGAVLAAAVWPHGGLLKTLLGVVAVVAVGFPQPPPMAGTLALAFLAGGGWAFLLIAVLWRLDPALPLRREAGVVVARMADMAGELIALGAAPHRDAQWHSEYGEHRRAVRLAIERWAALMERYPAGSAANLPAWHALFDAVETLFSALIALDHAHIHRLGPDEERAAVTRAVRVALVGCRLVLRERGDRPRRLQRAIRRLERLRARLTDETLIGCVMALEAALDAMARPMAPDEAPTRGSDAAPSRRRDRVRAALRPAARLAAGVGGVYAAAFVLHLGYPYWASMALIVVLQGGVRVTSARCLERILGSLLGGLLALALLQAVGGAVPLSALAILLAAASIASRSVNYTVFVVFLTMLFVIVTEMLHPGGTAASDRMLDNLVGSLAALLAVLVLWPDREPSLHGRLARGRDAHRAFREAVAGGGSKTQVRVARRAAGLASIDVEMALHDLAGLPRRRQGLSDADVATLREMRTFAGEAAAAWHRGLAAGGGVRRLEGRVLSDDALGSADPGRLLRRGADGARAEAPGER